MNNVQRQRNDYNNEIYDPRKDKSAKKRDVKLIMREKGSFDKIFFIIIVLLLLFGSVMVFSSSYAFALERYGDSYYFAGRQFLWACVGFAAMLLVSKFLDPAWIRKFTIPFFIVVIILNCCTRLPVIGVNKKNVFRWLKIGIEFQPSELLKLAVVLMFALYIVKYGEHMKKARYGIVYPFLCIGVISIIMAAQKHISGLIILAAIQVVMIFISGAPLTWLGALVAAGSGALWSLIMFTDYAATRINVWQDPWKYIQGDGWQNVQSILAIGSGGIFGVGLGQSRQKYLYLPEPQNDFIFSIVCEELGFIGAIAVIVLFGLLIWRGLVIAFRCSDKYSALVVFGIIMKVTIQTILNIGVVTKAFPNTGISLPFFSYGGTSLLILMAEMGIILSISRYSYIDK